MGTIYDDFVAWNRTAMVGDTFVEERCVPPVVFEVKVNDGWPVMDVFVGDQYLGTFKDARQAFNAASVEAVRQQVRSGK